MNNNVELSILMPCLNEAETLEICIKKAKTFLSDNNINGEILIADNGSTDGSKEIALRNGAKIVEIEERGYGAALIGGCNSAIGRYVIMGDADDSYDFLNLMPFLEKLRDGYDLVMGNRFKGGIAKGAMPPLHKYLGNPVLSFLGRLFFPSEIKDFHCGLRGYNTESIKELKLSTTGMEYASEMVVQATLNKLKITEVATTLEKDGRTRPPHLRSWRDGWRHLKFLLMHSPNWLFLYPGITLFLIGMTITVILEVKPITINNIIFDINTMLYAVVVMLVGFNMILFSIFTKVYSVKAKFIPIETKSEKLISLTSEKGVFIGFILSLIGVIATIIAFKVWSNNDFGQLNPEKIMRITIPSLAFIAIGVELMFAGFFVDILRFDIKS